MKLATLPANEHERIKELYRYDVLNTQAEEDFDQIVKLASEICQTPISTITLIDAFRQWHKARVGVSSPEGERNISFCAHAIHDDTMMVVPDAVADDRFHDNPLVVSDPNIRFYAGMPLISSNGFKIGTLCVIDRVPRKLTAEQSFALQVLAKQVTKLFELRLRNKEIDAKNAIAESQKLHLAELSSIQNKIISIVAHDIRGPIASLKNIIELRKDNIVSNEEVMEFMDVADAQLDTTMVLLGNLVEWGAILMKRSSVDLKDFNLRELLNDELKISEIALRTKGNVLQNQVDSDCMVHSDENRVRFILRNLISNANKFTDQGTIIVAAEQKEDLYRIRVTDTGIGMTTEIKNNLFDAYRRSSRRGTNKEDGSGLGLILTREFAQSLGTELTVVSEIGRGSSIYFMLPAAKKPA